MVGGVLAPPQGKLAQLNIINPKQEAALKEEAYASFAAGSS